MHDPSTLRKQAQKCRSLIRTATEPNLLEQLHMWSLELAGEARALERRAAEIADVFRLHESHRSGARARHLREKRLRTGGSPRRRPARLGPAGP
jgi:hypothetical protein